MIDFGLIDEWTPAPGRVTTWSATPAAVTAASAAPPHPVPASYQQQAYLRAARRNENAGFRFSRLCLISFDIGGRLDVDAMTRTVNAFIRRHDTFLSWFDIDDDDTVTRHVIEPDGVELAPVDHGDFADSESILAHVQTTTPGPFHWDCFTVGVIEHENDFTVYFAVDHLNSDGVSQALACVDLISLYGSSVGGTEPALAPAGSYLDYCVRERDTGAALDASDERVARWQSLLSANGGSLPRFPLDLGVAEEGYTRSRILTVPVLDGPAADRVDAVCRANGAGMTAGVLTVAGMVAHEITGSSRYLGFTPKNTRMTPEEFNSVGWFTNLIPVTTDFGPDSSFTSLVGQTQQSFDAGKALSEVSLHRVVELIGDDAGIDVPEGWVVPMVSFIDVRKLPGAQMFDHINGGVFGNRGSSEEVYLWVNRFPEYTVMTLLYPDTETAAASIQQYVDRFTGVFSSIATTGDYTPAAVSLAAR
ncbi:condensation domain-containing protein [Williamsia deligens]|uniref:Condensation domain-containing protein n=1 Tax=Williamsia deligens TaxID=321325 RepID=A0ABW3GCC0_9NOCA|nr:condensation domain-containing protein [Williamsia deligens]MCP2195537.1 Condensation domain-containing protein [Williamsia deligens]